MHSAILGNDLSEQTLIKISSVSRHRYHNWCMGAWNKSKTTTSYLAVLHVDQLLPFHWQMKIVTEFQSTTWQTLHAKEIRWHLYLPSEKKNKGFNKRNNQRTYRKESTKHVDQDTKWDFSAFLYTDHGLNSHEISIVFITKRFRELIDQSNNSRTAEGGIRSWVYGASVQKCHDPRHKVFRKSGRMGQNLFTDHAQKLSIK